jgi:polysaccharide export outer membrane protein
MLIPLLLVYRGAAAQSRVRDLSSLSLSPGDVIRIDVWQQKEYSGEFPIATDGSISHPLYREVKVTGIPLSEVEARLRTFLDRFLSNPTFVVQPLLRVIVAGEVRQPNIYTVPPGTTIAQVIALAGGANDRGRLDRVRVMRRGDSQIQTLDITRPDGSAADVEVHSGDQVIVARRYSIMQDVVAPSASILAALASVTTVILQVTRK